MRPRARQTNAVLIADSDLDRAERLSSACLERGIDVLLASHGAQALEIALAETPMAMVVEMGLPLIDGERLSAILRANPRTEAMRILLIADEHAEPPAADALGRVVPGHADPETVAHFLLTLLSKRQEAAGPEPEMPVAGGIEGDLAQVSLPELIELFHVNRKTGAIELLRRAGRREQRGRVLLRDGDLVHAVTGAVRGEKALYRLFAWDRGHFAFDPEAAEGDVSIERPTRALLREGRRQAAEWERLVVDLPPDSTRVALQVARASLPSVLHPLTQEVLMVLELVDRVRDVLDRCDFPDYQVLRTLATMHRKGLVELRRDEVGPGRPRSEQALPAPLATRLRERLDPGGRSDAKVLVFASDAGALTELCGLLDRLPDACLSSPGGQHPAVTALGRIAIDDDLGVSWLHAPALPGFAPAWPLAAHGAIGVVFVHAGEVETSLAGLQPAIACMARLPRMRVLHALLRGGDAESGLPALCEALSLFDDHSVVEIPLAEPQAALAAVRELLSRLLA